MQTTGVEILVSPETTRKFLTTAIQGLEKLKNNYPNANQLAKLSDFHKSVFNGGVK